jgi:hypothetical protein
VIPGQAVTALKRLPSRVLQELPGWLTKQIVKALSDHLQKHAQEFITATENTLEGATIELTLGNLQGFRQLDEALKGKSSALASLKLPESDPTVTLKIYPGYKHE